MPLHQQERVIADEKLATTEQKVTHDDEEVILGGATPHTSVGISQLPLELAGAKLPVANAKSQAKIRHC